MNWYKIFRYPFNKYGIQDGIYHVKWAWQRVFRGYDDRAEWGLCSYITDIALPVLRYLKEEKNGIPFIEYMQKKSFKSQEKEWKKIISKMIRAFELLKEEDDGTMYYLDVKKYNKEIQEGLALFAKYYQSLWG